MSGPLETAWREERAAIVASLARRLGDLSVAEDAAQEAFAAAAARWPRDGLPARPGAWLMTTAWRKGLDMARRERAPGRDGREWTETPAHDVTAGDAAGPESDLDLEDDVLTLVLTCCHPALAPEARVALTLRHVAGLTAREISAAFLVSEATMTKRLVRARAKIKDSGIRFAVPDSAALPERLAAVHATLYLVFSEGYHASGAGPAIRTELCDEAIWLVRQLHRLVPEDRETIGLLSLMLLQHARAKAREAVDGRLVPYDEQDPALWDAGAIDEARRLLARTGGRPPGPYQVQAAIALLHAVAPTPEALDWARIAELHALLARLAPSPVADVNRAIAVGRADGPYAGLAILARHLETGTITDYAPLHAAHADLLERAGRHAEAHRAWLRAAEVTDNQAQRAELARRADAAARFASPHRE